MKSQISNLKFKRSFAAGALIIFVLLLSPFHPFTLQPSVLHAQPARTLTDPQTENPNSSGFRLVICDGPKLPSTVAEPTNLGHPYVACDFNGIMKEVQHLINIAMILGVFAAIAGFCYMGYLFISGTEDNRKKAKDIFPKIFWGFIIMLTAWFIVYQILSWLTGNSSFTKLLGNP